MNHDLPPNVEAAWLVAKLWERNLLRPRNGQLANADSNSGLGLPEFLASAPKFSSSDVRQATELRVMRVLDRLSGDDSSCGRFTFGLPGNSQGRSFAWLGYRLIWWPCGIPTNPRLAIVSSRLGRPIETRRSWFAALRAACFAAECRNELLVCAEKTAADRFVRRAACLFELPLLAFQLARSGHSAGKWLLRSDQQRSAVAGEPDRSVPPVWPAWISPPLTSEAGGTAPLRDRVVFAAADRIFACLVRPGGNIEQLLERRINEPSGAALAPVLAVAADLVSHPVSDRLEKRGANLLPIHVPDRPGPVRAAALPNACLERPAPILALDQVPRIDAYLVHSTRHQFGPWPNQEMNDYLDDLVLDRPASDHSVLAALARIISGQRLIATGLAIRGGWRVVSFSAVPLSEIHAYRTYRPHRGRWDFEPYGLGIARTWLQKRGAEPVIYGDSQRWSTLSPNARPFFQVRKSGRNRAIDWSVEREWRHVGDVRLEELPDDAAFVFVRTRADAELLSPISRWPVVVVER